MKNDEKNISKQPDTGIDRETQSILDGIDITEEETACVTKQSANTEEQTDTSQEDVHDAEETDSAEEYEPTEEGYEEETELTETYSEETEPEEETDSEEDYKPQEEYGAYADDDEEPLSRKERKALKKTAKEAEKIAEMEAKLAKAMAKREDVNRASGGLRAFGIVTIVLVLVATAVIGYLVWTLMLSPSYVKDDGSKKEISYPEISDDNDASIWESLTPVGYDPEATPTDAETATDSDADTDDASGTEE